MKRAVITVLIALIALFVAGAVLFLANPFEPLFDKLIFGSDSGEISTQADILVSKTDDTALTSDFPEAQTLLENYFRYMLDCEGRADEDTDGCIEDLYLPMSADYLRDRLFLSSRASLAKYSRNDLLFDKCDTYLHYTGLVKANSLTLIVTLTQSARLYYGSLAAETDTVAHTFTLKYEHDWYIYSHQTSGGGYDFTNKVLSKLHNADGFSSGELTYTYLEPYFKKAKALVDDYAMENAALIYGNDETKLPDAEYLYNRQSAVSYALKWAASGKMLRNGQYGNYENDSADFVSQCIFAGEIPMDCQGGDDETQWKWYDSALSYRREQLGCTRSWSDCEKLIAYFNGNEGFGLVAAEVPSAAQLELGDVVFFLSDGHAASCAVVTAVARTSDGKIAEIFVSAHSPELKNVPLSSVCAEGLRFFKVVGYNSANI